MTNNTALITLDQITHMSPSKAVDVLRNKDSLKSIIERVRVEATSEVLDVNQKKDRERMGSLARTVSTSKTTLVKAIKAAIADMETKVRDVKATCKYAEDELNKIRDEVLSPRKAWEEEQARIQKEREEAIFLRIENIRQMGNVQYIADLSELKDMANALEAMPITIEHFEEFVGDAISARDEALRSINDAIIHQVQEEARANALAEQQVTIAINEIRLIPTEAFSKCASEIALMISELKQKSMSLSADSFGDRLTEAQQAADTSLQQLQILLNSKSEESQGSTPITLNSEQVESATPAIKRASLVSTTQHQLESGMVSISMREYRHLQQCEAELEALKAFGVDNWSGYADAMASLNDHAA
ncbi:hypothetical protein [Salinivibrio sp. YCSC6]|uniref:hypothetical protein n=1 Tax=Salinivibrio sp. YCSC6 TaxID=2003370 RepID=UPI000BBB89FC|nr:hypothetical protein [Salinivibrio sp. YCSC6]PCE67573.1 hypothetical protein B6G00_04285 [Salinivibrio sp. YCSC6]QCF35523.1 hypothetical protein E8E00_04675 [Salinivibrio sp. YCSC6]